MTALRADARLADIADRFRSAEQTPGEYLATLRERFGAVESDLQAFVDSPDWATLETETEALGGVGPDPKPPLYGVPVGVKDVFHVDGFETRAGSTVPPAELAGPQSPAVTSLIEAGAYVLGKTVTAEFAYFAPGPTRNPHDLARTPGGSSSGSAAAVAAGLCPLALGTQTIGSINRPASFCGVVGVKPSYGRIPAEGVVPVAPSVDTVGYFTQDVPGARLAASVLYDEWAGGVDHTPLERVGVVDGPYLQGASVVGRNQFRNIVDRLAGTDLDVERVTCFPDIEAVNERHERLVAGEMALSHSELFPEYGDRYADETRELIEEGRGIDVASLCEARAGRGALRERIHGTFADRSLDVIVSPSAPGPAPEGIDSTGDPVMNLPWTHAGVPAVTIPATQSDDSLPFGLQCVARFGEDERLLHWADAIRSLL